jgi:hypothetical protein
MRNIGLTAVLHCHLGVEGDTKSIRNIDVSPDMPFNKRIPLSPFEEKIAGSVARQDIF